jgi:hypothetical protein
MTSHPPHPAVLVDAGDQPWTRIQPVLEQRYAELPPGSELGVVVRDVDAAAELARWCSERSIRIGSVPGAHLESGPVYVLFTAAAHPLEEL